MRTLLSLIAGLLFSLPALAQVTSDGVTGGPSFYVTTPTNGQCFVFQSATGLWINSSCGGAGSVTSVGASSSGSVVITGSPITSSGTMTFDLAAFTGDCTSSAGTVALTCTKTSSVAFGPFATATLAVTPTLTALWTWNFTGQAANTQIDANLLENTTTASAGNQQEICTHLQGQGWGTTTPASAAVDWRVCVVPVQGTTAPTSNLVFYSSVGGGAYTAQDTFSSGGTLTNTAISSSGTIFGNALHPTGSGVNGNAIYLPAANQLGYSTNGVFAGDTDATQHWRLGGTAPPTIASGACGTGTNGTLSGSANDHAGEVIIGAAATTTCAIVFSASYTTAPRAVILTPGNAAAVGATVLPFVSAISASGFTITGSILASTSFYYWVQ